MAGTVILETPRLVLREFTEDDLPAYFALGSDPQVVRFVHRKLESLEHAREVLRATALADYAQHGYGRWACVLKETNAAVGFCGLKWLDEFQAPDLGYRFLPAHWGQGLATEAGRATLRHGFEAFGMPQVIALAAPGNVASVRVLRKLGMRRENTVDCLGEQLWKFVARRPGP